MDSRTAGRARLADVIVVTRHRVAEGGGPAFRSAAREALDVLAGARGFDSGRIGRATDDAALWVLVTTWRDVGSYRRAVSSTEAKLRVVPLLSTALDEPSAFEVLDTAGGPAGTSALAADAGTTRLGQAAAPVVPTDLDG